MAEKKELSPEERAQIVKEEQDKLKNAEVAKNEEAQAAREAAASGDGGDLRPPRPAQSISGTVPTFPNVPSEGWKPNPANEKDEMPPERQAPRPSDPKFIGQGRVKPHENASVEADKRAREPKPGED